MSKDKKNGRPESFNAEYFSHSVHESDVLKVMYRKFGYKGYTAYFRLKEQVAKADLHRIELKNDTQKNIFLMNMDVDQEVIDFLIETLLLTREMNQKQWEENQTIYLDKFVKQFKKLWYDRWKSIPDSDGNYLDRSEKKDVIRVSSTRNGDNRIEYNSNNKVEEDDALLSFDEYQKLYPEKDVIKSLTKMMTIVPDPTNSKARSWLEREINTKPMKFERAPSGLYKAYCSKCGNQEHPNDEHGLKKGSDCCRVEYVNKKPIKSSFNSSPTKEVLNEN